MDNEPTATTAERPPRLKHVLTFDERMAILNRRYKTLTGDQLTIAFIGIKRHLLACRALGMTMEEAESISALGEIITDAKAGRAVYAEEIPIAARDRDLPANYDRLVAAIGGLSNEQT